MFQRVISTPRNMYSRKLLPPVVDLLIVTLMVKSKGKGVPVLNKLSTMP
jgi:hypothetical protein